MLNTNNFTDNVKIAVIGLGYVGLPLAALFATKYPVVGFDLNPQRVKRINEGYDDSEELAPAKLHSALANGMVCTTDIEDIRDANFYVVAVPTPVDEDNTPDLTPLIKASETVGKVLKPGDYVVYESTVYPGTTEEVCVPELERVSGLKLNEDFFVGYSPERINPGDREHTVEKIVKITSASTEEAEDVVDAVYDSVLLNGTYRAPSIQVAEAAKVIENSQRDINIAFVNELSKIFHVLGIDTKEVLNAAATKWNFLNFHPGLVGGHCIGVDPYYLIQRSMLKGYRPKLMIEGRRINDTMGTYLASRVTDELIERGITVRKSSILILGFTFKENCHDIRNTKVKDLYKKLKSYTSKVTVYDPMADADEAKSAYGIDVHTKLKDITSKKYDAVIQCVNHNQFAYIDFNEILNPNGFVFYVNNPKLHADLQPYELAM